MFVQMMPKVLLIALLSVSFSFAASSLKSKVFLSVSVDYLLRPPSESPPALLVFREPDSIPCSLLVYKNWAANKTGPGRVLLARGKALSANSLVLSILTLSPEESETEKYDPRLSLSLECSPPSLFSVQPPSHIVMLGYGSDFEPDFPPFSDVAAPLHELRFTVHHKYVLPSTAGVSVGRRGSPHEESRGAEDEKLEQDISRAREPGDSKSGAAGNSNSHASGGGHSASISVRGVGLSQAWQLKAILVVFMAITAMEGLFVWLLLRK